MRILASALVATLSLSACAGSDRVLVAAGTTLVDSGLMDAVADEYERATGTRISVIAGSSAEALELVARREAVAGITHAPELEAAFVASHRDGVAVPVFTSEFNVVGPPGRVGELKGLDPVAALAAIADRNLTFVSRADGSGTYARELELWQMADIDPSGADWYVETGQGMGATLQVADQRDGFVLTELGTYLGAELLDLVPVELGGDPALLANPYRLLIEDRASSEASALAAWLTSPEGRDVVAAFGVERYGRSVYVPADG